MTAQLRTIGRNRQFMASAVIIALWAAVIVAAPWLARHDPTVQELSDRLLPPSLTHPFGTDALGRDVFARVLYGGQISLPAALVVVALGFLVGTAIGLAAGYVGGLVDEAAMRVTDMFLSFPMIILAMAVAAALGPGIMHGVMALAVVWWPQYARVARGLVLDMKHREFVLASRTAGRAPTAILLRVIVPNVISALVIMAAFHVGRAVLNFAILGFLGLGAQPPNPEWGTMIADGAQVMDQWWVATFPALAILTLTLAFNFLGDSTRDALDPWISGRGPSR
jgi:peptide/nickel transport system permease protein